MRRNILRSGPARAAGFVFTVLLLAAAASSPALETRHLFRIERSKNANIVQYDAQLTPDGRLYPEEPVIAYWIRLAENGQRRDLTFVQRHWAYGFTASYDAEKNTACLDMAAGIGRKIWVYAAGGRYRAEMRIDGRPAFIDKIYITSVKRAAFFPRVISIELYGKDVITGESRYEKIKP